LVSSISVNGDYLAESRAEGSIPSPQRRHHVDLNWKTGAADREFVLAVEETSGVFPGCIRGSPQRPEVL
jgi:hypothetical protein